MNNEKELAFRYDLFVTPEWRDRFDMLFDEYIEAPVDERILDVNCGTGSHSIELAEKMRGNGLVVGVDSSEERLELARAKAQIKKVGEVSFEQGRASDLRFANNEFGLVIGDASMMPTDEIEATLQEMARVAQPGARVVLKMTAHGSFGEFFSIFWEALFNVKIADEVMGELELLINEHLTVSDAEKMASQIGLKDVESFNSREEFFFESGQEFIESPLINDIFLPGWLDIVPEDLREEVLENIVSIIERERKDAPFDLSVKALLLTGIK